jgi:hypothetical protein
LPEQISAQKIMIIEIFVTKGQTVNTLPQHALQRMLNLVGGPAYQAIAGPTFWLVLFSDRPVVAAPTHRDFLWLAGSLFIVRDQAIGIAVPGAAAAEDAPKSSEM